MRPFRTLARMVPGGSRFRGAVLAAALVVVLGGCGEQQESARAGTDRSPEPSAAWTPVTGPSASPSSSPTPADAKGSRVPDGVESAAAEVGLPDLKQTPGGSARKRPGLDLRVHGADVSWPQCPKGQGIPQRKAHGAPMPTKAARFVVIGLTNGPSFTPNPCLARQVAWARERNLLTGAYAVTSYPTPTGLRRYGRTGPYDAGSLAGRLRNVGYQAALFNLENLERAGLASTPVIWVDVEPLTIFEWSRNHRLNRAVVQGTLRGYTDAGYRVGLYSTPYLWRQIVGDFRLGLPEWRAAGMSSRAEALRRCHPDWSFAGGHAVLGQWVEQDRDRNVTCPRAMTDVRHWFGRPANR